MLSSAGHAGKVRCRSPRLEWRRSRFAFRARRNGESTTTSVLGPGPGLASRVWRAWRVWAGGRERNQARQGLRQIWDGPARVCQACRSPPSDHQVHQLRRAHAHAQDSRGHKGGGMEVDGQTDDQTTSACPWRLNAASRGSASSAHSAVRVWAQARSSTRSETGGMGSEVGGLSRSHAGRISRG
jgi:hypothetical protein